MVCITLTVALIYPATVDANGLSTQDLNSGLKPTDLVNRLLGKGVTVSNVTFKGVNVAAGTFRGGTDIIGFEEGIILSSGKVGHVIGPNIEWGISWWAWPSVVPGDSDLDFLIPSYQTYEAAVLEFDFVPVGNKIQFDYVFGSDEYNEWVGSAFNDVFGFFINGVNQALIPDTTTPVSINNVNNGNPWLWYDVDPSHPEYYIDNDVEIGNNFLNTEMDGLTKVLRVTATVRPNETNHIKLAIADAGDDVLDSWVLIRAQSFVSIPELYLEPGTAADKAGIEHTLTATATLDGAQQQNVTVDFMIINGPNTGETGSAITDANGKATWSYTGNGGEGTDTIQATAIIGDINKTSNEAYKVWEAPPNQAPYALAGLGKTVEANTAGGALLTLDGSGSIDDGNVLPLVYTWSWVESGEAKNATGENPTVKLPLGETTITLTVYDGQFSDTDSVVITVEDTTPPELFVDCVESTNPRGKNVPGKNRGKNGKVKKNQNPDGFYKLTLTATDIYDSEVAAFIGTADDPFMFAINPGTKVIKFTEDADAPAEMKKMGTISKNGRAVAVEYHIILPGDPMISATDGSGNIASSETCLVPSSPM